MGACEPGHEWRPEHESTNYVRYLCARCGSVCVAPRPVEELSLVVWGAPIPRRAPSAGPGPPLEVLPWASAASSASPPAEPISRPRHRPASLDG